MDNADAGTENSPLVDVSHLPLNQLLSSNDTVLANSLRRLVAETEQQREVIAAFGNFAPIEEPPAEAAEQGSAGQD